MELRYKLKNDHYERENPDHNLKLKELLFLKYFEPEFEKKMKNLDFLVYSYSHPLSIAKSIIKTSVILLYFSIIFVLLSYYLSVDPSSTYSFDSLVKHSNGQNSTSFITQMFNPDLDHKLMNCKMLKKHGVIVFEYLKLKKSLK